MVGGAVQGPGSWIGAPPMHTYVPHKSWRPLGACEKEGSLNLNFRAARKAKEEPI